VRAFEICGHSWRVRFGRMPDVFIKEWKDLFREKLGQKILSQMGFEPGSLEI
jgi:hypothetical protein